MNVLHGAHTLAWSDEWIGVFNVFFFIETDAAHSATFTAYMIGILPLLEIVTSQTRGALVGWAFVKSKSVTDFIKVLTW